MIGIIGKKLGMTQLFNEAGQQIPCTVIEAEPNSVLQVVQPGYEINGRLLRPARVIVAKAP